MLQNIPALLREINVPALAKKLIEIPSYSFLENQEQSVGDYIQSLFEAEGIEVWQQPVAPGRPNVIARLPGGPGPSLMLCGHLDTVPPYDMENALTPTLEGGVLRGRGACDMKGAVAAMIAAMIAIKRSGFVLSGDLIFAGVADEEEGGIGAEYLTEHGPFADSAIIGEPTDLNICLGHKGLEWVRIEIEGRKVHGGDQALGVNAIQMAAKLIDRIYDDYLPLLQTRTHPVLGAASINVGRIEGGDQPSTVPGACTLLLDRRTVPGEAREAVYTELNALCDALRREEPNFHARVSDLMADCTKKPHYPYCVSPEEPVVQALQRALTGLGKPTEPTFFPAWSDAGTLKSFTDCIPVVCGPGQLKNAHSIHDSITETELFEAALLYARTVECYMKGE